MLGRLDILVKLTPGLVKFVVTVKLAPYAAEGLVTLATEPIVNDNKLANAVDPSAFPIESGLAPVAAANLSKDKLIVIH